MYTYFFLSAFEGFIGQGDKGVLETVISAQGNPVLLARQEKLVL